MDIQKSILALTGVIGSAAGLTMACVGLVTALKKLREELSKPKRPKGKKNQPVRTELQVPPTSLSTKLRKSWFFISGVLLIIASISVILYLILRPTPLRVEITQPTSSMPLNVKSDNAGSGEYPVEGAYTGDLKKDALEIYILVRSQSSPREPWYLQEHAATITREDTWYRRGTWRLEAASVGRGNPSDELKRGERWEILAVIAPNQDYRLSSPDNTLREIPVAQLKRLLDVKAQSEIVSIEVGDIKR